MSSSPRARFNPEKYRGLFLQECADRLPKLAAFAEAMGQQQFDKDLVQDGFRAIHSIKGGAGMFGLERLVPIAHVLEAALDPLRQGQTDLDQDKRHAIIKGLDCLTDLVEAETTGVNLPVGYEATALQRLCFASVEPSRPAAPPPQKADSYTTYLIRFTPDRNTLLRGIEPALMFKELRALGALTVRTDLANLPALAELDPKSCFLAFDLQLSTREPVEKIRSVFEFVDTGAVVKITSPEQPDQPKQLLQPDPIPAKPAPSPTPAKEPVAPQATVSPGDGTLNSIRVDTTRIDNLVNLVGEIAISQALVTQLIDQTLFNANPRLFQELSHLLSHTQQLHDTVMSIRAQPVRLVFDRMNRLVRELAEKLNKKIALRISGEATEIDKAVVEKLTDPIVHMLRNAADHGIETPEERHAAGKPETAVIQLHAEQRGSRIVIEISDDGRGLDRELIRQKAEERGLIPSGARLDDAQVDQLIFAAGFSTARNVSDISGRGVGLDVVHKNVQDFGGKISIRSQPGMGCTFILSLPLTLAVLEGLVLRCGQEHFVMPVSQVLECSVGWRKNARELPGVGQVLDARGRHMMVHDLRQSLCATAITPSQDDVAILVELENRDCAAFIADEIVGQQQVVVKKLNDNAWTTGGIAAATILGDGRVALILDPTEITRMAQGTSFAGLGRNAA